MENLVLGWAGSRRGKSLLILSYISFATVALLMGLSYRSFAYVSLDSSLSIAPVNGLSGGSRRPKYLISHIISPLYFSPEETLTGSGECDNLLCIMAPVSSE